MAKDYDHKAIEKKWQDEWEKNKTYKTPDKPEKKVYVLDMFPYPSGEGLHVGHPKGYIATDVYSRMKRMQGYGVLHPMGWDAFGLPAENYALKTKTHPRKAVDKNIVRYKKQLSIIGLDYDWSREIDTTDPAYYKWTQWIFLKLLEKGLAYQSFEPINWCPSCQTGLANEDLNADGTCERCDSVVEKRPMRQWVLKITDYADRLLADLDTLAWPGHIKEMQRNWIGRSEGAELSFVLRFHKDERHNDFRDEKGMPAKVAVFTTRPDTLYGATYLALAPEHPWVRAIWDVDRDDAVNNKEVVRAYVEAAGQKSDIERTAEGKEKTGLKLEGLGAINPATGEEIPIYVADYVLGHYGTGAVMGVPAHDERDFAFATKYDLPIIGVLGSEPFPYIGDGVLTNSGDFTGMPNEEAKAKITAHVGGVMKSTYKIQDWVFSRQRYWGEPIPVVHCEKDGVVPVPEKDLPVTLPEVEHYEPSGTGESPLANILDWVNTTCPTCGGPAKRETNTMPQWAGSSWYWLRFMDPHNAAAFVAPEVEKHWGPVDVYVGGDHAVRHLIYARFWHKFLYDIGAVHTLEPFARLEFLGFILAEDGRKMSKRWGNVINPDDVIATFGADAFRTYEMFMGPFENTIAWSTNGLVGTCRFIERLWRLADTAGEDVPELDVELNKTIKKVGEDIGAFKFNTAVSQMMILLNAAEAAGGIGKAQLASFIKILAPFAPHVTEELWHTMGHTTSIHLEPWPAYDTTKLVSDTVTVAIQVAGKMKGTVTVPRDASEEEVMQEVAKSDKLAQYIANKPSKVIFVPNKIMNLIP